MSASYPRLSSSDSRTNEDLESSDTDSESRAAARNTPPPPKRKKYACVFRAQVYPWATSSKKGSTYAFCTRCNRDISLGKGGSKDLRKHEQTSLHGTWDRASTGSSSIDTYFGPGRGASVVEAEIKFAYFLGEHHISFLVADHCSKLFRSMFPDSVIAKDFRCSRTKATAVLKVIAQDVRRQIVEVLHDSKFFSLQADETTDISVTQQMAIMLRFF